MYFILFKTQTRFFKKIRVSIIMTKLKDFQYSNTLRAPHKPSLTRNYKIMLT